MSAAVFQPVREAQAAQRRRFHLQETLLDDPPVLIPAVLSEATGAESALPAVPLSGANPMASLNTPTSSERLVNG